MDAYRQVISDNQWGSEGISLFFSSPPGEARLVDIDRRLDNTPNPLTTQQFREALVAKYGTPPRDDGPAIRWLSTEERCGAKEGVSTCRSGWLPYLIKIKTNKKHD